LRRLHQHSSGRHPDVSTSAARQRIPQRHVHGLNVSGLRHRAHHRDRRVDIPPRYFTTGSTKIAGLERAPHHPPSRGNRPRLFTSFRQTFGRWIVPFFFHTNRARQFVAVIDKQKTASRSSKPSFCDGRCSRLASSTVRTHLRQRAQEINANRIAKTHQFPSDLSDADIVLMSCQCWPNAGASSEPKSGRARTQKDLRAPFSRGGFAECVASCCQAKKSKVRLRVNNRNKMHFCDSGRITMMSRRRSRSARGSIELRM